MDGEDPPGKQALARRGTTTPVVDAPVATLGSLLCPSRDRTPRERAGGVSAPPRIDRTRPALLRALSRLAEPDPDPELCELLGLPPPPPADVCTQVFVLESHPFASVHLGPQGMLGGEASDRVAGFWRTLRLDPPPDADRLSRLLDLYAGLGAEELQSAGHRRHAVGSARAALFWEHLASWVPSYLGCVTHIGGAFYRSWATLLVEALAGEACTVPQRAQLPSALSRAAPPCDAGTRQALLDGLLAPVCSGMVVTRAELVQAGSELGLGVRLGERRYTLGALLDQDGPATLRWLASLATQWERRHQELHPDALAGVGEWWAGRARHTAGVLAAASAGATVMTPA